MLLKEIHIELKSRILYRLEDSFGHVLKYIEDFESPLFAKIAGLEDVYHRMQSLTLEERNRDLNNIRCALLRLVDKIRKKDLTSAAEKMGYKYTGKFVDSSVKPEKPRHETERIKILCAAANPKDSKNLRVYSEMRQIAEKIGTNQRFEFLPVFAARVSDFHFHVKYHKPSIIHFSGHGNEHGIILEKNDGSGDLVESEVLGDYFRRCANHLSCVFLNSCYSDRQAELIRASGAKVVGVRGQVNDTKARSFSNFFYDYLVKFPVLDFTEAFDYAMDGAMLKDGEEPDFIML